jgi:membrane protein YdbS with pleckstrin-like domain
MIILIILFLIVIVATYPKWSYKEWYFKMKRKTKKEKNNGILH